MEEKLKKIAKCIEFGKIDINSQYPPDMKGEKGADELTAEALASGIMPNELLDRGLIAGMERVGQKFSEHKIFVPQMLMSAKAMSKAMLHLKSYFNDGSLSKKGTFVIGTVMGDLHDIGKNLVSMMVEGNGWEIVDLGVDVPSESFIKNIEEHPNCVVGLSALLTTTMVNMEKVVNEIKISNPNTKVIIGGAPVSKEFSVKIGADAYSPDPQGAVKFLNKFAA